MLTGYDVFYEYQALKLHFNGNYDYMKYNGKTRTTQETYNKRKDKYWFGKVARKHRNIEEIQKLLISNFANNPKVYIINLDDKLLSEMNKIHSNLEYHIKNEIDYILDNELKLSEVFVTKDKGFPLILESYFAEEISKETLIFLLTYVNIYDKIDKLFSDNIIWKDLNKVLNKYKVFFEYPENTIENLRQYIIQKTKNR